MSLKEQSHVQGWQFCKRTCLKDYLRGSSRFAKASDGALRCAAVLASLKTGNAFRALSWSAPKPSVNQRSCMQHLMSVHGLDCKLASHSKILLSTHRLHMNTCGHAFRPCRRTQEGIA